MKTLKTPPKPILKVSPYLLKTCLSAAAAKSCQSCPTLCDSIDGSLPGSPNPGILQARTLEWVATCLWPLYPRGLDKSPVSKGSGGWPRIPGASREPRQLLSPEPSRAFIQKMVVNGSSLFSSLFVLLFWYRGHAFLGCCEGIKGGGNGHPLQYFAWRIPWTVEPGGLQSVGLHRVGCVWLTEQQQQTALKSLLLQLGKLGTDDTAWHTVILTLNTPDGDEWGWL